MSAPQHPRMLAVQVAATTGIVLITACGHDGPSLAAVGSDGRTPPPGMTARAEPGHCSGRIDDVSVSGDVTVPDGETCELVGTRVEGNISIGQGARLYASAVDVDGDIEGERTTAVEVTDSKVGGNLQLESGGSALVAHSHVDGDISWQEQDGELVARETSVGGNLEVEGNTGGVTVFADTIRGDLSCQDNSPVPQGRDNSVSGDAEDQCRAL